MKKRIHLSSPIKKLIVQEVQQKVWGCFSRDMIGPIHRIEGIMDGAVYRDIVSDKMLPHARAKMPRGWVFQQDNDPKHTSKVAKIFFETKKIRVL